MNVSNIMMMMINNHNIGQFLPCLENSYLPFKIQLGCPILWKPSLTESGHIYHSFHVPKAYNNINNI